MSQTNGHRHNPSAQSIYGPLGGGYDLILANRIDQLLANDFTSRSKIWQQAFDPRRDIDAECGYPSSQTGWGIGDINAEFYRSLYDREAIAERVVGVMPDECWQWSPWVYESEDPTKITAFEEAWDALGAQLRGEQSWFLDEKGSPVWEYLHRADRLSGIGHFGVILLGIDDMRMLDQPVDGVMTTVRPTINKKVSSIEKRLIQVARKAWKDKTEGNESPDYGSLFYNPTEGKVHYVLADGDGRDFEQRVKSELEAIVGIDNVVMGDEYSPPLGQGWIRLFKERGAWNANPEGHNQYTGRGGSRVMFHGTSAAAIRSVLKDGLTANTGHHNFSNDFYAGDRGKSIYLTPDYHSAEEYAFEAGQRTGTEPLILALKVPEEQVQSSEFDPGSHAFVYDERDPTAYRHSGTISPEYITGIHKVDMGGGGATVKESDDDVSLDAGDDVQWTSPNDFLKTVRNVRGSVVYVVVLIDKDGNYEVVPSSVIDRLKTTENANPEGHNQYTKGTTVGFQSGKQTVMGAVEEDSGPEKSHVSVRVTSYDKKGKYKVGDRALVHKDNVQVLNYSADQPRSHGKFARAGTEAGELAKKVWSGGGFTYRPIGGSSPHSGIVVSLPRGAGWEQPMPVQEFTKAKVLSYLKRVRDAVRDGKLDRTHTHVGAWHDKATDRIVLDVNEVYKSRKEAIHVGRKRHQDAVFDLSTFTEIDLRKGRHAVTNQRNRNGRGSGGDGRTDDCYPSQPTPIVNVRPVYRRDPKTGWPKLDRMVDADDLNLSSEGLMQWEVFNAARKAGHPPGQSPPPQRQPQQGGRAVADGSDAQYQNDPTGGPPNYGFAGAQGTDIQYQGTTFASPGSMATDYVRPLTPVNSGEPYTGEGGLYGQPANSTGPVSYGESQPRDGGPGNVAQDGCSDNNPPQYVGVELSPPEFPTDDDSRPKLTPRKLLFLRCFSEDLVQIVQYEADIRNPRFGQPVMYRITLNDPREQHSGIGLPMATVRVHWSRIIHLADNRNSSEIFGVPRQRPVLNRLLDLRKLYSGSAEMYWRGAFYGLSIETNPQLGGDVELDRSGIANDMEQYTSGLQRYLLLSGMTAKTLSPTVVDPTGQINTQIGAICVQLKMPIRVFQGSERGQLASAQDDSKWNGIVTARQNLYLTPRVIVPFIDRLIQCNVLPAPDEPDEDDSDDDDEDKDNSGQASNDSDDGDEDSNSQNGSSQSGNGNGKSKPAQNVRFVRRIQVQRNGRLITVNVTMQGVKTPAGYHIMWPDLDSLSDKDKSTIALTKTQALAAYVSGQCESVIPPHDYMTNFLGMEDEVAQQILDKASDAHENQDTMTMPPQTAGQPQPPPEGTQAFEDQQQQQEDKANAQKVALAAARAPKMAPPGFPGTKPGLSIAGGPKPSGGLPGAAGGGGPSSTGSAAAKAGGLPASDATPPGQPKPTGNVAVLNARIRLLTLNGRIDREIAATARKASQVLDVLRS